MKGRLPHLLALGCLAAALLTASCLGDAEGGLERLPDATAAPGTVPDAVPAPDTVPAPDALPDAAPAPDADAVPDAVPAEDTVPVPDTVPAPDTVAPQDTVPAPDTVAPQDTVPAPDTVAPQDTVPAPDTVAPQDTVPAPDTVCVPASCGPGTCGAFGDGCGGTLQCGGCTPPATCGGQGVAHVCAAPTPLPYPERDGYQLKAIQPDFWPDKDNISGNRAGGVAVNLAWWLWEPTPKAPPCGGAEVEFLGRCYAIEGGADDQIRGYSARGLRVTGVLYGSPPWARAGLGAACSPAAAGFAIFCKPDDPSLFGRFAGMLAHRYDGLNGHGRVVDFVIWNEVNSNVWFDIGCGQGVACNKNAWIDAYAALWNAAYDAIVAQQPTAKVFYSFEHHFAASYDAPAAAEPLLGVETFILGLASRVAPRTWRVAYHPYPPNLLKPAFGPDDWPRITYGNLGVLVGWLHQRFPGSAAAHDVHLTESGVNSLAPHSTQAAQAQGVCDSFINVLGTPGIDSYVYHRMKDHPDETAAGLGVGLHDANGQAKAAWATWALANRGDLTPPQLSCGFEHLPFTRLKRGYSATRGHWATAGLLPGAFTAEGSWRLWREAQPGTSLLFACRVGDHSLLTRAPSCESLPPLGPVGWIHDTPTPGAVPLYRCYVPSSGDHFVSGASNCEGQTVEQLLGYAYP